MLLEHEGISEHHGIIDAASMAKAIVHDDEGIKRHENVTMIVVQGLASS